MARRLASMIAAAILASRLGLAPAGADPAPPGEPAPPVAPAPPVPPAPPRLADDPDYARCLAMLPDDPVGANAWADAWEATGGGAPALHCRALAEVALGRPETGAPLLERAAAASGAPAAARAAVLGQAVQAWLMADDPARAYDAASGALALSPENPDLLVDRSVAAATMERYMDAIDDLTAALRLDPRRADALVFRAAAWRNEGRLSQAQADIEAAIRLDPDRPEALLERGILRQRLGDPDGARADWNRARALAPDSATADLAEQNLALLDAGPGR